MDKQTTEIKILRMVGRCNMEKIVIRTEEINGKQVALYLFPEMRARYGNITSLTCDGWTEISLEYYQKSTRPVKDREFLAKKFSWLENETGRKFALCHRLSYHTLRAVAWKN